MDTLKLKELSTDAICSITAQVAYAANRQYVDIIGGRVVNLTWAEAPYELKQSLIEAVRNHMTNPKTSEETHVAWCEARKAQGYRLGKHINHKKKTHSSLIRYQDLPFEEKLKDALFVGIVDIFTYALGGFVVPEVIIPKEQTLDNAVGSIGEGPTVGDDNSSVEEGISENASLPEEPGSAEMRQYILKKEGAGSELKKESGSTDKKSSGDVDPIPDDVA